MDKFKTQGHIPEKLHWTRASLEKDPWDAATGER